MKDAAGHGSNTRGMYLRPDGRSIIPTRPARGSGEYPARSNASNAAAAEALASTKVGTMVSVHPAMTPQFGKRK